MFEFRAERLPGKVFLDRATYLHDRISTEAVERPVNAHALCNAIGRANIPFNDKRVAPASQASRQPKRLPANFPWLTLVLGSGCATETTDDSGLAPIAPETIRSSLSKRPPLRDGMQPGDLAETFARNLMNQRMPKRPKPEMAPAIGPRDARVANLVLAASLLTSLYRGLAAASQQPLDPRGNDRLELTKKAPGAQRIPELRSVYADAVIEFLPEMWSDQPKAVEHVLRRIDGKLKEHPGYVDRLDLQILTEFTWLAMTEHCSMYYGWSSLLALVARADDSNPTPPHRSPPRPGFDRNAATGYIKEWYKKVTRQSWEQRKAAAQPSGRIRFFDSAARVLSAQSALRDRYRLQSSVLPPVASAFSTSFDIELEMSLAKHNVGFVMALPVHYLHAQRDPSSTEGTKRASLHWLGAVIEPAEGRDSDKAIELDRILRPNTWFMLSGMPWYDTWRYANWPFVVHLAGCPVIQLPEIGTPIYCAAHDSAEPQRIKDMPGVEAIAPAVLLDEYGAIQQHSTEMFAGLPSGASYGLPDQLTSPSEDSARARFWMLMGVQMGDAAIRYGIASRLGTGRRGLDTLKLPDRAGLVISSNVDPAARDLMQWYGVDLVQQDCGAFMEDLDHYSEHLEFEQADRWPSYFNPGDQCPLLKAKRETR